MDGTKRYYVIDVPGRGLTVHMPVGRADEIGVRMAMSEARLPWVLHVLRGRPQHLPDDYRERQRQVGDKLKTGRVIQLARVVRDLTWHSEWAHLTKTDSALLRQGRDLLAAEMALVSGDAVYDTTRLIDATVAAAVAKQLN